MIYWRKIAKKINLNLTEHQEFIVKNAKRFNTVVGGKRVGKTVLVSFLALLELWKTDRTIWVIAPSYELGERIFDRIAPWITRFMGDLVGSGMLKIYKTPGRVAIENKITNSRIEFKSANTETSLKGEALDLVIIDEAGDIDQSIWQEYLLPNIREVRSSGEKGKAFLIGNANYFGSWWHSMSQKTDEETFTYHLPTAIKEDGVWRSNNPEIITIEEIMKDLNQVPQNIWNKNYLAQFIPGQGTVFSSILDCATGEFKPPRQDRFYYIGIDLGRLQDFTVISVVDSKTFELVHWDRFKELEWPFQKKKIIEVAQRYANHKIKIDQTGLGQPIVDELNRTGIYVEGVTMTNEIKKNLIEKLSILLEWKNISYPKIDVLIKELEVFGYNISDKTKRIQYGAPFGFHDDAVISLALAVDELQGAPSLMESKDWTPQELIRLSSKVETERMLSLEESKPYIRPKSYI